MTMSTKTIAHLYILLSLVHGSVITENFGEIGGGLRSPSHDAGDSITEFNAQPNSDVRKIGDMPKLRIRRAATSTFTLQTTTTTTTTSTTTTIGSTSRIPTSPVIMIGNSAIPVNSTHTSIATSPSPTGTSSSYVPTTSVSARITTKTATNIRSSSISNTLSSSTTPASNTLGNNTSSSIPANSSISGTTPTSSINGSTISSNFSDLNVTGETTVSNASTISTTPTVTCDAPPSLTNGKIRSVTLTSAEYRCLGGFAMLGQATIFCVNKTWRGTLPSCSVINKNSAIHFHVPETQRIWTWWQVLATVCCPLLLLIVGLLILYFFCSRPQKVRPNEDICEIKDKREVKEIENLEKTGMVNNGNETTNPLPPHSTYLDITKDLDQGTDQETHIWVENSLLETGAHDTKVQPGQNNSNKKMNGLKTSSYTHTTAVNAAARNPKVQPRRTVNVPPVRKETTGRSPGRGGSDVRVMRNSVRTNRDETDGCMNESFDSGTLTPSVQRGRSDRPSGNRYNAQARTKVGQNRNPIGNLNQTPKSKQRDPPLNDVPPRYVLVEEYDPGPEGPDQGFQNPLQLLNVQGRPRLVRVLHEVV